MKPVVVAALLMISTVAALQAATITVRRDGTGDFTLLQPALDAASPGDTIDIGPGEYTEFQTVRPSGWGWDIDIYAYITVDDLTIVGAGPEFTVIGPPVNNIDSSRFSPKGFWALDLSNLSARDLTIHNCYTGIYGPNESIRADNCHFEIVYCGVFAIAGVVFVEGCLFRGSDGFANGVYHRNPVSSSVVRNSQFYDCRGYYDQVEVFIVENCEFIGGSNGITVYNGSIGTIANCYFSGHETQSLRVKSPDSSCYAYDIEIVDSRYGVEVERGNFTGESLSIRGTTSNAVGISEANHVEIHHSDILPGYGYAVECYQSGYPPSRIYDLTDNYWGVTDEVAIAALIWDAGDSPSIDDYVDFVPFASDSVPTESMTWGAVKALFE